MFYKLIFNNYFKYLKNFYFLNKDKKNYINKSIIENYKPYILPSSFTTYLYEYKKGVKKLVLYTCQVQYLNIICKKLKQTKIDFICFYLNNNHVNIFFGYKYCIDVIKTFSSNNLTKISKEEDFILGTMLGYSIKEQTLRYLSRF